MNNCPDDINRWFEQRISDLNYRADNAIVPEGTSYSYADVERAKADVLKEIHDFLKKHVTYSLESLELDQELKIMDDLPNLTFQKTELEDIIFLQPFGNGIPADELQDIASNLDRLRSIGCLKEDKAFMILDPKIKIIRAKLVVTGTPPKV